MKTIIGMILLVASCTAFAKGSSHVTPTSLRTVVSITCLIKINPTLIIDGNKIIRISVSPYDNTEIRLFFGSQYDSYTAVTANDPIKYIDYLYNTINDCKNEH